MQGYHAMLTIQFSFLLQHLIILFFFLLLIAKLYKRTIYFSPFFYPVPSTLIHPSTNKEAVPGTLNSNSVG